MLTSSMSYAALISVACRRDSTKSTERSSAIAVWFTNACRSFGLAVDLCPRSVGDIHPQDAVFDDGGLDGQAGSRYGISL